MGVSPRSLSKLRIPNPKGVTFPASGSRCCVDTTAVIDLAFNTHPQHRCHPFGVWCGTAGHGDPQKLPNSVVDIKPHLQS